MDRNARIDQLSLIHVPRVCTDVEVQEFLEGYFLEFRPGNAKSGLSALQAFTAARERFGDYRCLDLTIPVH